MPEKLYGEMQMTCCDSSGNPGGDPPDKGTDKEMACGAGGGPDDIINPEGAVGTPKHDEIFTDGDPDKVKKTIQDMSLKEVIQDLLKKDIIPLMPNEKHFLGAMKYFLANLILIHKYIMNFYNQTQ